MTDTGLLGDDVLACLAAGDPGAALTLLERADAAGGTARVHAARGIVLLADGRPQEALAALRIATSLGAADPVTRLNLALAERAAGDAIRAGRMLRDLARECPEWEEPHLRLAEQARADRDRAGAEEAYRAALARAPGRREVLVALGALRIERGDAREALLLLKRCCALHEASHEAWDALGLALLLDGTCEMAAAAFARARRLAPGKIDYALHAVEAALRQEAGEQALARFEREAEADPLDVAAIMARGELLARLGRRDEAVDAFELAVALAPDDRVPARKLGLLLAESLRQHEAEPAMRRAIALDPGNVDLGIVLSVVLMRLQRHAEVRRLLEDLIAQHGEDAALLGNLGMTQLALGLQDDARATAERGVELAPSHVGTWRAVANILPYGSSASGALLLEAARETARRLPRPAPLAFDTVPDPERRLRIGLLSGMFKVHPVGWLTIAGFEALDRTRFELVCLRQQVSQDFIGRRFEAIAAECHDTHGLDDAALAALCRARDIDVLIDLGGYGDFGRMTACAHRLAPVQIKWVGMQNGSTGMDEMDFFMADRWEIPPEHEAFYSERPLRLADGYVCYSPPPDAPEVAELPALANGHVTFGCYNNLAKLTPAVLAAWAGILHAVPGARLVLKTHQFGEAETCARISGVFAGHGLDPSRIELRGASPHRMLLAQYGDIDMVLDPFPYSGGLTTCEALWMGVPTVTFPGTTFASRHSFSHLSNVGLSDWIAEDLAGYRALAVAKAGDIPALAALRRRLRAQVRASPLCDAPRFGRSLGEGLRQAWRDWCAARA